MREYCTSGSVAGAPGNRSPYAGGSWYLENELDPGIFAPLSCLLRASRCKPLYINHPCLMLLTFAKFFDFV